MAFHNPFKRFVTKSKKPLVSQDSPLDVTASSNIAKTDPDLAKQLGAIQGHRANDESFMAAFKMRENPIFPPVVLQEGQVGYNCNIKELYSERSMRGYERWSETKPVDLVEDATDWNEFAILQRQSPDGSQRGWQTHSIVINSPYIKSRLIFLFEDYPGVDTKSKELVLFHPFIPMTHRWRDFVRIVANENNTSVKRHLRLFHDFMESQLQPTFQSLEYIKTTKVCSYENLPLIMNPGETVIKVENDCLEAGVVCMVQLANRIDIVAYEVIVNVVDWSGKSFGVARKNWLIEYFAGTRSLRNLDIFPLRGCPDEEDITSQLVARGRMFEELQGRHFRSYSGVVKESKVRRTFSGRVMVDQEGYHKLTRTEIPKLQPLKDLRILRGIEAVASYSDPSTPEKVGMKVELSLTQNDQRLHTVSTVKGFAFEGKFYGDFEVTSFKSIDWDSNAFENLVVDADTKRLLVALSRPYDESNPKRLTRFDDFITGKGRGTIMLLHGPPGVGKTLTAESIAEHIKRPLFRLVAGDLGITGDTVIKNLEDALEMCTLWEAVLLVDEADVFLEARSIDSLERNELVSIFLQALEYYDGVMVLTTNRIHQLDLAFESRMDLILSYKSLDESRRRQVWENIVRKLDQDAVDLKTEDLEELAKIDLNGRQIKSAVKIANVLAINEDVPLRMHHLSTVIEHRLSSTKVLGTSLEGKRV